MMPALDSIFNTIKFLVKVKIENWKKSQLLISVPAIWPKIIQNATSISNYTNVKRMELLINFEKVCVSSQKIILVLILLYFVNRYSANKC